MLRWSIPPRRRACATRCFRPPRPNSGEGVPYEIEYALLPEGAGEGRPRFIVEDIGRWFAGPDGRPARAYGVVRVVNQRHEREQRLAFLSRYDDLTGFYNRTHLLTTLGEALEHARQSRIAIAFLIVAVDNFRAINDAYGFEVADQVLAAAARRIKGGTARRRRHRPLFRQQARPRADELRRGQHAGRGRAVSRGGARRHHQRGGKFAFRSPSRSAASACRATGGP